MMTANAVADINASRIDVDTTGDNFAFRQSPWRIEEALRENADFPHSIRGPSSAARIQRWCSDSGRQHRAMEGNVFGGGTRVNRRIRPLG